LRATLVVEDESGFSLVSPLKRTWAPRGQTPCVRTSLDHHERLNLLGAVLVTPKGRRLKLMIRSHRRTLRGEEVIAFLTALLRRICGPIVLVWDNHPIHQRKLVQAFLAQQTRLHIYALPTGAPELNPMEWVWQQVDEHTAGTAPHNRFELRTNVMAGVSRVRRSQQRVRAGFLGAHLTL
jgi:transposase